MMKEEVSVKTFYDEGSKGRLVGLRCPFGHITVPPRHSCGMCQSQELRTVELSGKGRVLSFTEVHAKSGGFPLATPYTLALVTLDEGGKLMGIISSVSDKVAFGASVKVNFKEIPDEFALRLPEKKRPRIFFELQ